MAPDNLLWIPWSELTARLQAQIRYMRINTLFMDIGGVITEPNPEFWNCLRQRWGAPNNVEELFYGQDSPWVACRVGQITYREHTAQMAVQLGMTSEQLMRVRHDGEWRLNRPMVSWIHKHRDKNLKVIAVSNADDQLEDRLTEFGVIDLFDYVINSARVGLAKPDPRIYRLALTKADTSPEQCLFVDDKARNIEPAAALGMKTWVYSGFDTFTEAVRGLMD